MQTTLLLDGKKVGNCLSCSRLKLLDNYLLKMKFCGVLCFDKTLVFGCCLKYRLKRNGEVVLSLLHREVMGMVEEEEERRRTRRKEVERGAGEARRKHQGSGKQGVERKQKSQGQKPVLRKVSVHEEEELLGQGPLMITKVS